VTSSNLEIFFRVRRQIKLRVIPKPASGTRIVFAPFSSAYIGDDTSAPDYVCGNCSCVFMTKVNTLVLDNIIIKCPRCGAFNDADLQRDAGAGGSDQTAAFLAESPDTRMPSSRRRLDSAISSTARSKTC